MGLKGRVGQTGADLQMPISEKKSEERGKRELLDGGGKRPPSLLNLPPTTVESRGALAIEDYGKKSWMRIQ